MGEVVRLTNSRPVGRSSSTSRTARSSASRPIELDDDDDAPSWKIEARGRTFTPPRKTTYSPTRPGASPWSTRDKRILTPLKRVDFDPDGERNTQNRGVSGYEPISWDEALDIVADEIIRVKRELGPAAILSTPQLPPPVGQRRLPPQHLLPLHEPHGLHLRRAQPGQLGRLALGRHAHVGLQPPPRHPRAVRPPRGRAEEHRDDRLLVGRSRRPTARHLRRLRESPSAASG